MATPLSRPRFTPPVASAVLATLVFAITLGGTFIYDDVAIIEVDRRIADVRLWGQYWTDSYNFGVDNLYRPLVSMTFAVQRYLHGLRPMPFHLVNLVLHAAVSALVAVLAMRLAARCGIDAGRTRAIGWIAGVLFAVHPVHVEAVANVVGRAELMCAAGALGAMILCLEPLSPRRVVGIYLLFVLALLSKEQGMLTPLLMGIALLAARSARHSSDLLAPFRRDREGPSDPGHTETDPAGLGETDAKQRERSAVLFVLIACTLAGYVAYRESILKFWWDPSFLDPWIQPMVGASTRDRVLVSIAIMGRYLQLLVAPSTLRIDYGGVIVPGVARLDDAYLWLGLFAIALWLGLFAIALRGRDRFTLAALLMFAFVYGLIGNLVTLIGVNVAERLMYLPSAFFLFVVARWLSRLPTRAWVSLLALIATAYSIRSFTYARHWNDRLGFYLYQARVEPRSMKALLLAALEQMEHGDLVAAERLAHQALAVDPEYEDAVLRLGQILVEAGRYDEAERLYNLAHDRNPAGRAMTYRRKLEERRAATQQAAQER